MADMIVEYKIMPENGEIEYSDLERVAKETVENYHDDVKILEVNEFPVGFGLKAVKVKFQMDENHGTDSIEEQLMAREEVGEVECTLMDRL